MLYIRKKGATLLDIVLSPLLTVVGQFVIYTLLPVSPLIILTCLLAAKNKKGKKKTPEVQEKRRCVYHRYLKVHGSSRYQILQHPYY